MEYGRNMLPTRIVFWEPQSSPHKSEFLSSVARLCPDIDIFCCAAGGLGPDRKALGWEITGGGFTTYEAPSQDQIHRLVTEDIESTLHVFSGFRWHSMLVSALNLVLAHRARFALLCEPRANEGLKGLLRFIHSILTEQRIRNSVSFVLGIGRHGPDWFKKTLYREENIFPFAYFVDPPYQAQEPKADITSCLRPLRLCFCGRLVKDKGILDFIEAIVNLKIAHEITIVGDGPLKQVANQILGRQSASYSIIGAIPRRDIGNILVDQDILVLPSKTTHDGWGVVVSEALMSGTAVIVSSAAGASVVMQNPLCGLSIPPNDSAKLTKAILEINQSGILAKNLRYSRKQWALKHLSADAGARHFLAILRHIYLGTVRPRPFYLDND